LTFLKQEIIDLFEKAKTERITFNPAVRVQREPALWIDKMQKVKDTIAVTLSKPGDSFNCNLDKLNEDYFIHLKEGLEEYHKGNKRYRVLSDVTSNFRKGVKPITYAKRNDKVKMISKNGSIAVVESESGQKFSMKADQLQELSN
jgi:hypothetical protein